MDHALLIISAEDSASGSPWMHSELEALTWQNASTLAAMVGNMSCPATA